MRPAAIAFFSLVLFAASPARSAEMSIGTNFTVLAPSQALADAVAKQAEIYRAEAAQEWLATKLPDRQGRTLITVEVTSQKDEGLTWPIDCAKRTLHQVWLSTSVDRAVGTTLHHEVIHTVLDTHCYPEALPAWASEGIASQADDAGRRRSERQLLSDWSKSGKWPSLQSLFNVDQIHHDDLNSYAAASSATEFLAGRAGKPRVVEFAASGQRRGWDQAARDRYGFRDMAELQSAWQDWVSKSLGN